MSELRPLVRVLLVEDEIEAARLVTRRLTYYPGVRFEVTHVVDLSSAFSRIEREGFDVMVLDLCLPDGEGFETLASACAVARHLPIVVLTGVDDDQMSLRAIRAGAQDYLIKPLTDVRPVARALLNACERHRRQHLVFERPPTRAPAQELMA
jgi:DNA-binding response OmpR family regulator